MNKKRELNYNELSEEEYTKEFVDAFIKPMERYQNNIFYRIYIDTCDFFSRFKKLGRTTDKLKKLKKWNHRIGKCIERNVHRSPIVEFKRVASFLKLPGSVATEGLNACDLVIKKKILLRKGISQENMVASIILNLCKKYNLKITPAQISYASGIEIKEIENVSGLFRGFLR